LIHADLRDAQLRRANLQGANLLLADFSGADLSGCNLSHTTLHADNELGHVRQGPRFTDANLYQADMRHAACIRSDFSGATLTEAQLQSGVLTGANLNELDLSALDLSRADLSSARLRGANLHSTTLFAANLEHADLQGATLTQADVRSARLQSANLENAQADGIEYDRNTTFRGIRAVTCYGSSRFRRFAQDQDYIEEFRDAHPFYYAAWYVVTDCGRSIARVVAWSLVITVAFSLIYYALGADAFTVSNADGLGWTLFTTLYYSVVTFTTLGFGDITPYTRTAAAIVMVEVIVGYVMLGILISILANKVARRS
ncbi:MAG: pentapeptide repeat-containing protein, partial [Pseudomonadota bacterium]